MTLEQLNFTSNAEDLVLHINKNANSNWSKFYSSNCPLYILDPYSKVIPKFYLFQTDEFMKESLEFYQRNINIPISYLFLGMYQEYFTDKGVMSQETINIYLKGNIDPFCMIKLAEAYIRINESLHLRSIISLFLTSFIITSIESNNLLNPNIQIIIKSNDINFSNFDNFYYLSYYYEVYPNIFLEVLEEVVLRENCSHHFKDALILIFSSMHNSNQHLVIMQKLFDAIKCDDMKSAFHFCCFSLYFDKLKNCNISNIEAIFHILKIIADEGNPFASEKLAVLYEQNKDYKNAFNYYCKAEDYLLPYSLNQLGIYYCTIKNPIKNIDTKKAYEFWTKASYSGMVTSLDYLKLIQINCDYKRLFNLSNYKYKCKIRNSEIYLGYCYEKGKGVEKNAKIALGLYKNGIVSCKDLNVFLYRIARLMENEGNVFCNEIYKSIFSQYKKSLEEDKKDLNNMWIIDAYRLASMYKKGRGIAKNINMSLELLNLILNAKISSESSCYACIFFYVLALEKRHQISKQIFLTKVDFFESNGKLNGNSKTSLLNINDFNKLNESITLLDKNSFVSQLSTGEMDTDTDNSFLVDYKVQDNRQKKNITSVSNNPIITINKDNIMNNNLIAYNDESNNLINDSNKTDNPQELKKYICQTTISRSGDFQDNVLFHISKMFNGKKILKKHENDFIIIKSLLQNISMSSIKVIDYNDIMFDSIIGNGGFSKVFSGWIDKSSYAIKEFQNVNETNIKRIFEEINIHASLNNENINKVLFIAFDLNPFKIACINKLMLYNLRYVINSVKPNIKLKTKIVKQILNSLNFLHSQCPPVVHRDLKPENILLDENFHVEICDFGIFKVLDKDKTCSETSNQFYTARYSPPEVIKNCQFICKASDIWSVGLLIYDIFYEEQPWNCLSGDEIADCIKRERPFPVKNHPHIPSYIISIIKRCTIYDYSMRPKVSDLLKEVEDFLKDSESLNF